MGTQRHRLAGFVAFVVVAGGLTVAVDYADEQSDSLACCFRANEAAQGCVAGETEQEERTDGLRSGRGQRRRLSGHVRCSNGVEPGPRSTMSK